MIMEEWSDVLPLVEYVINHWSRDRLGGRTLIEVMTGRAPDSALDLVLWTGLRLADADVVEADIDQSDIHCDRLQVSLDSMYEELKEGDLVVNSQRWSRTQTSDSLIDSRSATSSW